MVTAHSFNPSNLDGTSLSTAQMQALEQAIRYLSQDPRAAALLKEAADRGVTIKLFAENNAGYYPGSNHIRWNPEFSPQVRDRENTGYASPAMVLLHEIAHSVDQRLDPALPQPYDQYMPQHCRIPLSSVFSPGDCTRSGPNAQPVYTSDEHLLGMEDSVERFATETETEIARSLGEPVRTTYKDIVSDPQGYLVSKPALSPVDSSREYYLAGKLYQEDSRGHAREPDGSTYTKTIVSFDRSRQKESETTRRSDENFQPVSESIARYDHQRGIISTTTTHYQILDADGKPTVTNKLTDLRGNPIHSSEQNPAPDVSKTEPPSPLSQLAQRVLNSSRAELDQMGRDIANSPLGEQFRQRGIALREEQQVQQRQQEQEAREQAQQQAQQHAQQHIHRGPVMR